MTYDTYDGYLLGEYRIIQTVLGYYAPQHNTPLGWQSIKEPQPTIQQARNIIDIHRCNAADADALADKMSHADDDIDRTQDVDISSPHTHT